MGFDVGPDSEGRGKRSDEIKVPNWADPQISRIGVEVHDIGQNGMPELLALQIDGLKLEQLPSIRAGKDFNSSGRVKMTGLTTCSATSIPDLAS